jgi:nucleotide-binding universal stress UspA family protein
MEPRRILVVMSTTRWSKRIGDVVLREAKAGPAEIEVLYVVEQDEIDKSIQRASDSGFLGPRTQASLVQTLVDENKRVAERRRERVRLAVEAVGCTSTWREVVGDYEEEVRRATETGHYDVIVLVRSDESFLHRLFYGSEDDRVATWVRTEGGGAEVLVEEGVESDESRTR